MIEYFKLIEDYIKDYDVGYKSIKDLTIALAKSGGYYRANYTFKCGTVRERTLYSKKFDSKLVAKWLCFYKRLFYSKLSRYPELNDYYVFIINKTFFITMCCINLDKLTCDDIVNKYVNMALSSRIKEALGRKMIPNKDNIRVCNRDVFNNNMFPLDVIDFNLEDCNCRLEESDLALELENIFENNELGYKLLMYMLNSTKKVPLNNIDVYLNLSKDECTEENRVVIADAYNIIKYMLLQYVGNKKRFRKIKPSSVKYSFEV